MRIDTHTHLYFCIHKTFHKLWKLVVVRGRSENCSGVDTGGRKTCATKVTLGFWSPWDTLPIYKLN